MRHQNKPIAPITYLNNRGKVTSIDEKRYGDWSTLLNLSLKEVAILQTGLNRAFFNCNCDLNKDVLESILNKVKESLEHVGYEP